MFLFLHFKSRFKVIIVNLLFSTILITFPSSGNELKNVEQQLKAANSLRSSDPKKFNSILNKLIKVKSLSNKQKNDLDYLLAYQVAYSGNFKEAIPLFEKIINSNANIDLKFRANSSIINISAISQDWRQGFVHLNKAIQMMPKVKNSLIKQDSLIITSFFYYGLGQYTLGYKYAQQVKENTKNKRNLCAANYLMIKAKFYLKTLQKNDLEIQDSIELCKMVKEQIYVHDILFYLANLHLNNNDVLLAITLLKNNIGHLEKTKFTPLIAQYNSLLAKAYFLNKEFSKAKQYANTSLLKTEGIGNTAEIILAYSLLYKIALHNNDHQQALTHYIKYAEADKAHLENEKAKHLAFQLAEHKELEQKNQIALLNKKNSLLTAEQALIKANAENNRFIMIILIMTLSILILWGVRLLRAHKRIKELAEYDALTGIFNRGHFTQVANNAITYCQSAKQELSLIMFDLDHFKNINDSYGHACGDWALKKVAEVCKSIGRQNDIFARLGGEEFCILLTSCDSKAAQLRAEACRQAIAEIITTDSGFEFSITASFGVTEAKISGFELEQLLADADSATYAAKHAGRNKVTLFQAKTTIEQAVTLDNSQNVF